MQRIAVIGKLKSSSAERADEIVDDGPPFVLEETSLERHSVFVSSDWVVFVFEGPNVEGMVDRFVDDPVVSANFSVWGPILEGTPQLGHERFFWQRPLNTPVQTTPAGES